MFWRKADSHCDHLEASGVFPFSKQLVHAGPLPQPTPPEMVTWPPTDSIFPPLSMLTPGNSPPSACLWWEWSHVLFLQVAPLPPLWDLVPVTLPHLPTLVDILCMPAKVLGHEGHAVPSPVGLPGMAASDGSVWLHGRGS